MLRIILKAEEGFNDSTQTFEPIESVVIDLEHSLVSLSKWESEFQKPFLSSEEKSREEIFGYLNSMLLTPEVDPNVFLRFSPEEILKVQSYIDSPQSATTFGMMPESNVRGEVITSELIYYWLVAFTIPFECQYWHLNRLFSLIRICNIKNSKPRQLSRHEIALRNQELNAKRRAELGTKG